jgi:cytochrome c-type biogenesis protein CcmH/NrfG
VDGLLQEAGRELVAGNRDKANALAKQVLAEDAGNARARKLMEQAGKAEPKATDAATVRALYYAGVEQYLQGDLKGAVATWRKVLAMDPEHLDAKRSITRALIELDALEKRGK